MAGIAILAAEMLNFCVQMCIRDRHYTALKASPFVENSGIGFILFGSACDLALPLQQLCEVKMLLVNPLRRDYFPAMISVIEASEEESMFLQIKAKLENIV